MFRATKYRIYPNAEQEVLLAKHFGCVRWLYNRALASKKEAWEIEKRNVTRYDLSAELPKLKKADETCWLREVNSQSLQAALVNLDMAYTRFFREKKGFPRFKSKHHRQSFQVPQSGEVGDDFVKIPKVGKLKASISRATGGKIKTITISRTPTGKYFASVLVEDGTELPEKLPATEAGTVGIDLGLKHFAVLSTGEVVANPRPLKKRLRRLRRAQRRLSKRTKGSSNRQKQRKVVARIHERVTNTRNNFLHQLTARFVRDSQTDSFAIEDLAVANMCKNHRLARSIADAGWGTFREFLEYKAERAGKNVLVIGRFEPSSKTDHKTGAYLPDLKLSDRVIRHADGTVTDRDLNAAINIKRFALHPQNKSVASEGRETTPVETVVRRSSKQESPRL
jgi:putative transposase